MRFKVGDRIINPLNFERQGWVWRIIEADTERGYTYQVIQGPSHHCGAITKDPSFASALSTDGACVRLLSGVEVMVDLVDG